MIHSFARHMMLGLAVAVLTMTWVRAQPEDLPESRPFLMGMSPFPYDLTQQAQDYTYDQLAQHTDLILHHMDTGIPWDEALTGQPYHPAVQENIAQRVEQRTPGQKVYLSITPNSLEDRNQIAGYWAEDESLPLPEPWQGRTFDDPMVIEAFLNHARYMIGQFQPDYFAYGIEVTCANRGSDDRAFQQFINFAEQVYTILKAEYPDLPIFATICALSLENDDLNDLLEANRQVIQYSDLIGLSIYPYLFGEIGLRGEANPADTLPADWLSRWAMLDPSKPFAITETAYIAQDLKMDTFGIEITGSEQHQAAYVQRLLNEAARLNAEFVIWFIMRDYDQFVTTIESFGIPSEAFLIWRDTGLINEAGQGRPAFEIWQDWLALPLVTGTNQAHSDS